MRLKSEVDANQERGASGRPKGRALAMTMGVALVLGGCHSEGGEEAGSVDENFTLTDGSKFVVSAESNRVVLKTTLGDCSGCSLLEALERDSHNKIGSLDDLKGKKVFIHPIDEKAEDGAFLTVQALSEKADRLTLEG